MKPTILYIGLLLLFSSNAYSQNILIKDLDGGKREKSTETSNDDKDEKSFSRKENDFVKLNIGLMTRGAVSLSYERQFLDRFGIEATIGTVLWTDFMAFNLDFPGNYDTIKTYSDYQDWNDFNPTFSNLYLGAAFRAYTNEQEGGYNYFAIYRFFGGLDVRSFRQQYIMGSDEFDPADPSNRFLTVQNFYTGVQLGYMVESDYNSVIQEATIGLGLITRSADELLLDTQNTYQYGLMPERKTYSRPYFTLGYKIGLKF